MLLGTASPSYYIVLNADYRFNQAKQLQRKDNRTLGGSLFTYISPNPHTRYRVPETWVSSENRSLVNSWWANAVNLQFIPDSTYPASLYNVRIMGAEEPYPAFVQPYFNQFFSGELVLETL